MSNQRAQARDEELALLFSDARTHYAWQPTPVSDELLHKIYDTAKWAPTGSNAQPLRIVFAKSAGAKDRIKPALPPTNVEKVMTSGATAILAWDAAWYDKLPEVAPFRPGAREQIAALPAEVRDAMGQQAAAMQAGYFILAARALGLDCGPIGGFDRAKIDAAFFEGSTWRSFVLVNLGHGVPEKTMPRQPRLAFEAVARIE